MPCFFCQQIELEETNVTLVTQYPIEPLDIIFSFERIRAFELHFYNTLSKNQNPPKWVDFFHYNFYHLEKGK